MEPEGKKTQRRERLCLEGDEISLIRRKKQTYVCDLFRSLTRKSDDSHYLQSSEKNSSRRSSSSTTTDMTQQVLRLAEKINDQYLTCKICLV